MFVIAMCGIISVIDRSRNPMDGSKIQHALALMNERGSGEGADRIADFVIEKGGLAKSTASPSDQSRIP